MNEARPADVHALRRNLEISPAVASDPTSFLEREWLVTNGLGGYAAGTLAGVTTRRYHGLLIAALPAPLGRIVMFSQLGERVRLPGGLVHWLSGEEKHGGSLFIEGAQHLTEFRLEAGLPVWRYELEGFVLEKRVLLPHQQNSVLVTYRLVQGNGKVRLGLRPLLNARPHEAPVDHPLPPDPGILARGERIEVAMAADIPPLRIALAETRGAFTFDPTTVTHLHYRLEESRGYQAIGDAWSPGYFRVDLAPGQQTTLVASTEPWETMTALGPEQAYDSELERRRRLLSNAEPWTSDPIAAELVLAADQFIVTPAGRVEDAARARAAGDEARTVIAGYHWFTDWGRDTMISLEGLTLTTGRTSEARDILRTFAFYFRDGLIPNLFPEGTRDGLYHTADATLWFFHALDRYVSVTQDTATLELLIPVLEDSLNVHIRGTAFGIGVDPEDGLLRQGAEGYQLTWMDAKVGDWVVTPRRGKAVEINALWYNALRLLAQWLGERGHDDRSEALLSRARQASDSFNGRFWYQAGGYLYDVVDGEAGHDAACRPNQVLTISLRFPVLDRSRWQSVIDVVTERLLTPVGLRSLDPSHPDYKTQYDGDLRARDAAYHQGTVWAWLIGPYVDAWMRVYPDRVAEARTCLEGFVSHLDAACIGSISEIFDATPPYTPRGCVAQAWSVAEVLRAWVKTGAVTAVSAARDQHLAQSESVSGNP